MKNLAISSLTLLFSALASLAQTTSVQETSEKLVSDPVFSHATVGICVMRADGEKLAGVNEHKMITPASNMKLISTGAALHELGEDFKFTTDIAYDGEITDGTLKGNIYIIGGADPTLGSKDTLATPLNELFDLWEKGIREVGINKIEGYIIGDGRWLDGMSEEPSWLLSDLGTYYGTGVTGLMFYENMQSFSVSAGEKVGDPINISPHYPSCSWMNFIYEGITGEKGTGDQLYMFTSEFVPVAAIRGTFGIDRGAKRVDCSNKFPEYTCAVYFKNYLQQKGIACTGGAADFKFKNEWTAGERLPAGRGLNGEALKCFTSTESPSLRRIAFATNHASNNLYAETLLRTLGKEYRGSSCYDSSYVALNGALKKMHLNPSNGLKVQDGSGLSRQNLVSADFFCRFLGAMMDSECFEAFLGSLPIPGGNGSLNYNMKGYSEALRSRIRVKSGSMNGVRCYTGYILPENFAFKRGEKIPQEIKDQIIIFSVMTSNCVSPNWKVRPLLDKFMAELTK